MSETELGLVWEEPPVPITKYDRIVEELKKKPNEWARIKTGSNGATYGTSKSLKNHARGGTIETKVVRLEEGGNEYRVYARYIPKGKNGDE